MSVAAELKKKQNQLNGRTINDIEVDGLKQKLPSDLVPDWYVSMLKAFPLVWVSFCLDEENDESEMGADLKWFSPDEVIEEASLAYPGRSVTALGYLPVASCLVGSGDPYFLKIKSGESDNPALVRVPHDAASGNDYPEDDIEVVCESLSDFFRLSTIEG